MKKQIKQIRRICANMASKLDISRKSDYYRFGFEYFGPFLYGYTKWLENNVREKAIDKVFFFSRDGFMMEKAFRLFNTENNIKTEYVYFSRKSLRQALLWRCDSYSKSLKYLSAARYISIGTLLEYYGFSEEERIDIAQKEILNLDEDLVFQELESNKRINDLYDKLREKISDKSKQQDMLLYKYLQQIGFAGNCAIVDIGWYGSMQYYLEEFIQWYKIKIVIFGYYIGIKSRIPLKGAADGYLYNEQNEKLRKSVLCFFGVLEKLFQNCEGSTYGYTSKGEYVIPIKGKYEYEGKKKFIGYIEEWQNGAIDFVKLIMKETTDLVNVKEWALPLMEFGKKPSLKGIRLFSFFYITDGKKEYFVAQKSLFQYNLKELIHALSNSTWKTGFLKSVFKLPLPYYWIYSVVRK